MSEFEGIYSDLTRQVINAAIEVHTELGCGLKEEAYEAALVWELSQRGHKVQRQMPCPVIYKGKVFCKDDDHPILALRLISSKTPKLPVAKATLKRNELVQQHQGRRILIDGHAKE